MLRFKRWWENWLNYCMCWAVAMTALDSSSLNSFRLFTLLCRWMTGWCIDCENKATGQVIQFRVTAKYIRCSLHVCRLATFVARQNLIWCFPSMSAFIFISDRSINDGVQFFAYILCNMQAETIWDSRGFSTSVYYRIRLILRNLKSRLYLYIIY